MTVAKNVAKNAGRFISKNSPHILSALAVGGVVTTAVLAGKAHHEAMSIIEHDESVSPPAESFKERLKDRASTTWQCYIPPVTMGAATIACVIAANSIHANRQAAIAGAYSLADAAFREYKDQVVRTIGEKKEGAIQDEVATRQFTQNYDGTAIVISGSGGDTLCYDTFTGRFFKSDFNTLQKAEIKINKTIINDGHASANEFFTELGLEYLDSMDDVGWNTDSMIKLRLTSVLDQSLPNPQPAIAIGYDVNPFPRYMDPWR